MACKTLEAGVSLIVHCARKIRSGCTRPSGLELTVEVLLETALEVDSRGIG